MFLMTLLHVLGPHAARERPSATHVLGPHAARERPSATHVLGPHAARERPSAKRAGNHALIDLC